ncbi:hypothetical protein TrRE_jg5053 [Triparma retinervis]|uniref:J domain-containing protein n=1 Tax=Triparma retinervis TaxID=2557542 RepID=A0A9W7CI05_9STRA|nr:hypothetical protein TrRE_jg5053 [Triparma retinervis]
MEDTLENARKAAERGREEKDRLEKEAYLSSEEARKEATRAKREKQWEADLQRMSKAQRSQAKKKRASDAKIVTRVLTASDHYAALGLGKSRWRPLSASPRSVTTQSVKKAYRNLAKKVHPDKNKDARAEEAFDVIQGAYEVLSDEGKKRDYDRKEERRKKAQNEERKEMAVEGAGKVLGVISLLTRILSRLLGPASTSFFILGALII